MPSPAAASGRSSGTRRPQVAALRKPVLAAWVVNRLVRDAAEGDEGARRRRRDDPAGRKGGEERLRDALEQLMRAARQLLEAEGRESGRRRARDVATTLRTGAAEAPEELAAGRLTRPLEPSGFAAMAGATLSGRGEFGGAKKAMNRR